MQTKYKADIEVLDREAEVWYNEVREYQMSARGLLDSITTLSGDVVKSAVDQLQQVANGDVKLIQDFADKWGFDRPNTNKIESVKKNKE